MTGNSNSNVRVIGDIESIIDILNAHMEEENCTHSVKDFLEECFDKKNKNKILGVGRPDTSSNNQQQMKPTTTATNPNWTEEEGG